MAVDERDSSFKRLQQLRCGGDQASIKINLMPKAVANDGCDNHSTYALIFSFSPDPESYDIIISRA